MLLLYQCYFHEMFVKKINVNATQDEMLSAITLVNQRDFITLAYCTNMQIEVCFPAFYCMGFNCLVNMSNCKIIIFYHRKFEKGKVRFIYRTKMID